MGRSVAGGIFWALLALPAAAQDHQYGAEEIQAGYRLYFTQCEQCHGRGGDGIATVNLARQQFPRAVTDDDIGRAIRTGNTRGMPPFSLRPEEVDALIAFIRSGMDVEGIAFRIGDAALGKAIYYGKGGCSACHRVAGQGPRAAPDLSDIGYTRRPGQILTALTEPNRATLPINRPVTIAMKDGRTVRGRRLNEDSFTVQLIDEHEQLLSVDKTDIRQFDIGRVTAMPSYRDKLSDDELSDLLGWLVSLKVP